MVRDIVLIGGGGHCVSCIDAIESAGNWNIVAILDMPEHVGKRVRGYTITGSDVDIETIAREHRYALVTVGHIKSSVVRKKLFEAAVRAGFSLEVVCASSARVSSHAFVGKGSVILHGAYVNANASIGVNCIVNTGSIVEHDAIIGDHCHISTGAIVNGGCSVGSDCFVGSGAVIQNGIRICDNVTIGSGAVVTRDITETGIYIGCPAKKMI